MTPALLPLLPAHALTALAFAWSLLRSHRLHRRRRSRPLPPQVWPGPKWRVVDFREARMARVREGGEW